MKYSDWEWDNFETESKTLTVPLVEVKKFLSTKFNLPRIKISSREVASITCDMEYALMVDPTGYEKKMFGIYKDLKKEWPGVKKVLAKKFKNYVPGKFNPTYDDPSLFGFVERSITLEIDKMIKEVNETKETLH